MREERLTVEDVKWHIRDAFDVLKERCGRGAALQEANTSEARVMAFLTQCEAVAKQRDTALNACRAFIEGRDSGEVWNLAKQALDQPSPDPATEALIAALRGRLKAMDNDERHRVIEAVAEDYCRYCGSDESDRSCVCMRDE